MEVQGSRSSRRNACTRLLALALVVFGMLGSLPFTSRGASAESPGTVYVHIYGCPTEIGQTTNYDTLASNCTGTPFYNGVWITTEGVTTKGSPSNENLDWTFEKVPAHIFSIRVTAEPYYAKPVVYCANGSSNGYQQMETTVTDQGSYVRPTLTGGYVTCDWFAKSNTGDDTGSISIDAFACPADFDGANADMNELYVACKAPQNGVDFVVDSYINLPMGEITGANADGNVYFQYVEPDFVQITATPLYGFDNQRVFCRSNMENITQEFPAIGATFAYNLRSGERFECDWYNIPAAGAIVHITNHLCPDGENLTDASIYTLAQTCQMTMNGVEFELESPADGRRNFTGDNAGSAIKWFDIVPGLTTIHESAPAGYLTPRVFCSASNASDGDVGDEIEYKVTNNTVSRDIQGDEYLLCDWFNLPDGGVAQAGSIAIFPIACPNEFDIDNASLQKASQKCATPQDLTLFELVTLNETYSHASGWWESGTVVFWGIGANEGLTLVAHPRDGFKTGAVFCGQSLLADGQVNGYDKMDTTDTNTIFPAVVPGAQNICHWFMTPTEGGANNANVLDGNDQDGSDDSGDSGDNGSNGDNGEDAGDSQDNGLDPDYLWTGRVEITVRDCPSGIDASDDLESNCFQDGNGHDFGIYSADQWWPQNSGDWADQMVIWDPVPVQEVTVQETLSGGYDTPVVYCDGGQMNVSGDGAIELDVHDGETIECTWFNVES